MIFYIVSKLLAIRGERKYSLWHAKKIFSFSGLGFGIIIDDEFEIILKRNFSENKGHNANSKVKLVSIKLH